MIQIKLSLKNDKQNRETSNQLHEVCKCVDLENTAMYRSCSSVSLKKGHIALRQYSMAISSLHQQMKDRSALLLRFTSLLLEVMILKESSPQLVTKLLGTEEYEKENNRGAIS